MQSLTQKLSKRLSPDNLGVGLSALCIVHCALTPLLLSLSIVAAHALPSEERVHRTLAVLISAIGAIALIRGFRKHGRRRTLLLMALGLACIFGTAYAGDSLPSHAWEVTITTFGSLLMISAHRMNHTFCRNCTVCCDK